MPSSTDPDARLIPLRILVGARLHALRIEAKKTREEVSPLINRGYPSLRKYEAGEIMAPMPVLEALARVYGVTVSELLDEKR